LLGAWQAGQVIQLAAAIGQPLIGRLATVDLRTNSVEVIALRPDPDCAACGAGAVSGGGAVSDVGAVSDGGAPSGR
jgi:hypothetical protein